MKKTYFIAAVALLALFSAAIACDLTRPVCKNRPAPYLHTVNQPVIDKIPAPDVWTDQFGPLQTPAAL